MEKNYPTLENYDKSLFKIRGKYLDKYTGSDKHVDIPLGINCINSNAFSDCKTVESVTIPDGVIVIMAWAFSGCGVKHITLPSGVQELWEGAFYRCSSLESIDIPDSVKIVHDRAFSGCTALKSVRFPRGAVTVSAHSFEGCTALTSVTLPSGVEGIEEYAFKGCKSLVDINVPDGIYGIDGHAFEGCKSLDIAIPNGLKSIEEYSFKGCAIKNLVIPDSVNYLYAHAFENCKALTSVVIPKNIVEIPEYAFNGCIKLESVKFVGVPFSIEARAFGGCGKLVDITVPKGADVEKTAFEGCKMLKGEPFETIKKPLPTDIDKGARPDGRGLKLHVHSEINCSDKPKVVDLYGKAGTCLFNNSNIRIERFVQRVNGEQGVEIYVNEGYDGSRYVTLFPGSSYLYSYTTVTITGPTDWEEDDYSDLMNLVLVKE